MHLEHSKNKEKNGMINRIIAYLKRNKNDPTIIIELLNNHRYHCEALFNRDDALVERVH